MPGRQELLAAGSVDEGSRRGAAGVAEAGSSLLGSGVRMMKGDPGGAPGAAAGCPGGGDMRGGGPSRGALAAMTACN